MDTADVVVVGFGFAGGMAAVAASDAGASVILLEKMPYPGGLSVVSGGGLAAADDEEGAFAYLQRTCNGTTPDPVLRAMARGMVALPEWIRELERHSSERFEDVRSVIDPGAHATYPFPGGSSIRSMKIAPAETLNYLPWVHGLRGGTRLFKLLLDNVTARKIDVRYESPAVRLLPDADGGVAGVQTDQGPIHARRGVILACGGFEWNEEMKRQYWAGGPVYGVTALGNTGDGVRMCQEVGADLWHMWHAHGSYGFKFDEYEEAFRHRIQGPRVPSRKMPWILLDKRGRRFMNEYPPAPQDTAIRELLTYDPDTQDYPRIPCWMIFDDAGRATGPVAFPMFEGEDRARYVWSEDNLAEVERGWIVRAESLEALAEATQVPAATLRDQVARWNASCAAGEDLDHGRLPGTMMALSTPPYYAVKCWPVVNNTQGGPVHDADQRVLRPDGTPVPRLYAAGELGSLFGHLYLEAGNVAECFITGRFAALHAIRGRVD